MDGPSFLAVPGKFKDQTIPRGAEQMLSPPTQERTSFPIAHSLH